MCTGIQLEEAAKRRQRLWVHHEGVLPARCGLESQEDHEHAVSGASRDLADLGPADLGPVQHADEACQARPSRRPSLAQSSGGAGLEQRIES